MTTKVVVQSLWIGDTLSDMEVYSIKSFMKIGYKFHLYTYGKVDRVPKGTIIKDASEIIPKKDIFTLKEMFLPFADIWRYKLLYLKGGYWVDIDMIAIKPFHLLSNEYIFSSERTIQKGAYKLKEKNIPNIGILKAPKGSPFYKEAYDISMEIQRKGNNTDKIKYMRIIRNLITKYKYEKYVFPAKYFCHLSWWHAKDAFLPTKGNLNNPFKEKYGVKGYSIDSMFNSKNVYTIHLWRSLLIHKYHIDLNGTYDNKSLWELLKKYIDKL